jgi:hypothetical protein
VNALKRKTYQISGFVRTAEKLEAKVLESKLEFDDLIFSKLYKILTLL